MDILGSCTYYTIDTDKIKNEDLYNYLIKYWGVCDDNILIALDGLTISKYREQFGYDCFRDSIDYNTAELDEYQLEDTLHQLIGNFPYYLVFAKNVRWDGASGYTLCNNILDTIRRNYDITIKYIKDVKNGIECTEYSHDVPTGSSTYIIGINEDEYETLSNADFYEVCIFVNNTVV